MESDIESDDNQSDVESIDAPNKRLQSFKTFTGRLSFGLVAQPTLVDAIQKDKKAKGDPLEVIKIRAKDVGEGPEAKSNPKKKLKEQKGTAI